MELAILTGQLCGTLTMALIILIIWDIWFRE